MASLQLVLLWVARHDELAVVVLLGVALGA
jgi:hypothetical protein